MLRGTGRESPGHEPCDVDVFASAFSARCVLQSPLTEANLIKQTVCQFMGVRLSHCYCLCIQRVIMLDHFTGSHHDCKYFERVPLAWLVALRRFCAAQRIQASDFVTRRLLGVLRLNGEAGNIARHVCWVKDVTIHEAVSIPVTFDADIGIIRRCLAAKR